QLLRVRVLLALDDAGLHEGLRDVRTQDVLARGDLSDPLEAHRRAELLELLHHPLAPPEPALLQPEELGLELGALLVGPVAEHVEAGALVLRGELHAWDELDAGA